jgi:hypothetical protein
MPVQADCLADEGDVDVIAADGVTVVCDDASPNPFPVGVGSGGTNTNLTVVLDDEDAAIDSADVGVNLGDGGVLTNMGTITAVDQAVLGTNLAGGEGVTITNDGTVTSTAGVGIASALVNSEVTNNGVIEAETAGVLVSGSDVDNADTGSIIVYNVLGVGIDAGDTSTVTNSGGITSAGVGLNLGVDSVADNAGTIDADATAVVMAGGTVLTNTGRVASIAGLAIDAIDGAEIVNAGVINGGATDAIRLSGGGNQLTLQTGSEVDGRIFAVAVTPSDVLILEGTGSEDDNIENFGSLVMQGESWTLTGQVEALAVEIETGNLGINGTLDTRDGGLTPGLVQLMGGTLSGTGTILGDVLNSGGTMAAGSPAGTLTVVGDYVQGADAFLHVGSGSGQVGVLDVGGTATLTGTAIISAGSDGIFEFLVADDGIIGAFDDVAVDGRAVVSLLPSANSVSFIRASTTVEDNMVDAAVDNALLTLDSLSSGSESAGAGGPWFKVLGHYGDRDEVDGLAGGDYTIGGGAVGGDWVFASGKSRLGAAVGYTTTDVDIDDGSDGEADNIIYGLYYEYRGETVFANLALGGGSNEFDHTRSIFVGDELEQASASYDGTSAGARAEIGLSHPFRGDLRHTWLFEPMVGVDYVVIDLDPYTEQGGAGLRIDADDIEAVETSLLLRARRISSAAYGIAPRMHIGVVHQAAIDDRKWTATDVDSGISFILPGDDDEDTALSVGFGADFTLSRRVSGFFDYLGEFSDDVESHSVLAGLRVDL